MFNTWRYNYEAPLCFTLQGSYEFIFIIIGINYGPHFMKRVINWLKPMVSRKWGEPQSAPLAYNENESSSPESRMKRVDSSVAAVRGLKYRGKAFHLRKIGMHESATAWSVERSKRKPHSRYLIFNRQTSHVQSAKSLVSVLHNSNTGNCSISSYCSNNAIPI